MSKNVGIKNGRKKGEKVEKKLGLYVHIPFCASRCKYCDFCSLAGHDDLIPAYCTAISSQMEEAAPRFEEYYVDTVYFGGGTPSYFGAKNLIKLLNELKKDYNILKSSEITVEVNPDSISYKDMKRLRRNGVNRLSVGMQSANDAILQFIGRRHNFAKVEKTVENAKRAGFDNISLDLIYGLPAQSRMDWEKTLNCAIALKPTHISCYGLRLEEGTPLYEYRDSPEMPDDDTQADMYLYACETLKNYGYRQYEISNFALPGRESRHNLKYWQLEDYLGFGPAAASNIGNLRYTIIDDVEEYIKSVGSGEELLKECEQLNNYERCGEYIMLGLRTARGISQEEYQEIYNINFEPLKRLLEYYEKNGWMHSWQGRWSLTPKGMLISNTLISELMDAQADEKLTTGTPWKRREL